MGIGSVSGVASMEGAAGDGEAIARCAVSLKRLELVDLALMGDDEVPELGFGGNWRPRFRCTILSYGVYPPLATTITWLT